MLYSMNVNNTVLGGPCLGWAHTRTGAYDQNIRRDVWPDYISCVPALRARSKDLQEMLYSLSTQSYEKSVQEIRSIKMR